MNITTIRYFCQFYDKKTKSMKIGCWYDQVAKKVHRSVLFQISLSLTNSICNQDALIQDYVKRQIREHCNS